MKLSKGALAGNRVKDVVCHNLSTFQPVFTSCKNLLKDRALATCLVCRDLDWTTHLPKSSLSITAEP